MLMSEIYKIARLITDDINFKAGIMSEDKNEGNIYSDQLEDDGYDINKCIDMIVDLNRGYVDDLNQFLEMPSITDAGNDHIRVINNRKIVKLIRFITDVSDAVSNWARYGRPQSRDARFRTPPAIINSIGRYVRANKTNCSDVFADWAETIIQILSRIGGHYDEYV